MKKSQMEKYWTNPETYKDPKEFDTRFASENLSFWVPNFIRIGRIEPGMRVLDIGCGTGGFSISIHTRTGAKMVGLDLSHSLLSYATEKPNSQSVTWIRGNAETLPFADESFDCIIMSLVLHQIVQRAQAIRDVFRVLRPGGWAIIRTIEPEAVRELIPFRFFPQVAEVEAARLPALSEIKSMLSAAGFDTIRVEIVVRNRELDLMEVINSLKNRLRPSYELLTEKMLEEGLVEIKREWEQQGNKLVNLRPTAFIIGEKRENK